MNIETKLDLIAKNFKQFLYASNPHVVKSLKSKGFLEDDIRRIELFDWFQGVGLYGYYKMYKHTKDQKYLQIIMEYFDDRIKDGLPSKNINSMAPMLTMVSILDEDNYAKYGEICKEWASWLYNEHPRTLQGGLSHLTCEAENRQELWDDTLFMSVLFLAKAGVVFDKQAYIDEALYQYSLHEYYLSDRVSGLWYHGWTFEGCHNFSKAFWARGNAWITIFVPELLDIIGETNLKRQLLRTYKTQIKSLISLSSENGLYHTLLNDNQTYIEASGSAGIIYGLLKGYNDGLIDCLDHSLLEKGISSLLACVDEKGLVHGVSAGTAMGHDLDYYRKIPLEAKPYGQALTMLAFIEYMRGKDEKIL
ncbi:glycoside hydrolase family 105 protein [Acidaminobacter sp. JC074]|uniref:glycoside hydrolase family 88/105 protein n=1 Tax=Acidaminobacter sp. JC074 TaxID=2530199 RepID=UPI001F0D20F5|nr:glycoside hydrolase family 88 protein [Acidaminobacter sp. JC074]MCH4886978.1 glycoside hydrolase family 105 protein [Acidaminobacter sp. JC074]